MNATELPLLDLFTRLRDQHGWPLGIDEYMLIMRALRAGFGVGNSMAIVRLCSTLWAKSPEESCLLHRLFAQILAETPIQPREPYSSGLPTLPPERALMQSPTDTLTPSSASSSLPTPSLWPSMDEPAQVVRAVRHSAYTDIEISHSRHSLLTEYFPVTRRQMKQSWRHLRRLVREGPSEELDVRATVEQVGREGILLELVLVPRRINRAELVLFIDQDGSMVPFHVLSRQLVETARRGGRLAQAGVYYFHDCPDTFLYRDPARRTARSTTEVLASFSERAVALIVSDAGAARSSFDPERIERTRRFIQDLKQVAQHYAWLNPMPDFRWLGTTADEVARFVPMFEMSHRGLDAAIGALRGRYVYRETRYSWMR